MKIAALFLLVVLVIVASLEPASGKQCTCVTYIKKFPKKLANNEELIPSYWLSKGAKYACKRMAQDKDSYGEDLANMKKNHGC